MLSETWIRAMTCFALWAATALAPAPAAAQTFAARTAVPDAPCRSGDHPETDLQGRIPPLDLIGGIGNPEMFQPYTCNLDLVGRFAAPGGGTLDSFGNCAYYGRLVGAFGTQVLDVSDPSNPVSTATLDTPAMQDPWESLRVNQKRQLLVADSNFNGYLDIYDVSGDCRHPRLLSSTDMSPAQGHEGWFSPDGLTYYMSRTGPTGTPTLFPVDISDPAKPRRLASWALATQTHGGFTTEDGKTSYVCEQQVPPMDALDVMDTSDIADRSADPQPVVRTHIGLQDNQWCQSALRVTYNGRPFLIQYGERSGAADCSRVDDNWASFGYPRFYDLANERAPKLVGTALLESALPQYCSDVTGEGAFNGLGYSVHQCSVDRLYDPTILACSYFFAGMRVMDIRDPTHPVEIAYYNPGVGAIVGTAPRPVVRAEQREIWFANDTTGFYVVRFAKGTWPFAGSARCPEFDDYYYAQYNPGSTCRTANLDGIGKPAPGSAPPAKQCRTARRVTVHLRTPKHFVVTKVVAVVGGRVVKTRRGHARSLRVSFKGLPAGRNRVVLRITGHRRGHTRRTVIDRRTFRLCAPH
jgi:hypothetical protein